MGSQKTKHDCCGSHHGKTSASATEMDPVCGMTVDRSRVQFKTNYKGQDYFFCSSHCLHKFQSAPEQFVKDVKPQKKESAVAKKGAQYTCPMHPEVVRDKPGNCPICGMALEPMEISGAEEKNPELLDMQKRFWASLILTLPLAFMAMGEMLPFMQKITHAAWSRWLQLILATPVILWGGWSFFQRAWQSLIHRSPNMFTLIAMGDRKSVV